MKSRHLILLILLAIIFGGWAYMSSLRTNRGVPSLAGTKVLPNLPINEIRQIVITTPDSTHTVARLEGEWVVPSRYGYPADFEKVADTMTQLADLTVGQIVNVSPDQLGELNLLTPGDSVDEREAGVLAELFDKEGRLLDSLIIGKLFLRRPEQMPADPMMRFDGYPDGQYVRRGDDTVFLVSQTLRRLKEDVKTWLDDRFIDVHASEISEITVTGPDRDTLRLARGKDDGFELEGIDTEKEILNKSKVNQMAGALRRLSFYDIADPAMTPEETGLDSPVLFTARTRKNRVYTIEIGRESEGTGSRYARARVEYLPSQPAGDQAEGVSGEDEAQAPELNDSAAAWDSEQARATELLDSRLSGWTFMIRSFRANPLLTLREDLVDRIEELEEEE